MRDRRIRSACCRWRTRRSPRPAGRSRASTGSRSAPAPVRSPASASVAAWRRGLPLARICRSFRFPRWRRSRRRFSARTAGTACWPASTRGCARSTRRPMPAAVANGGKWRRPRCSRPPRSCARTLSGIATGPAPATASPPIPRSAVSLGSRGWQAEARPTAQSVGELALPRLAAGEGVAASAALPLYVRHRVALTSAEQGAGVRL